MYFNEQPFSNIYSNQPPTYYNGELQENRIPNDQHVFHDNLTNYSNQQPAAWQAFIRQLPPHQHGPERLEERPPHTQHVDWASMFPNEVILHGPTNRRQVALTFDDGPDDVWTPQILNALRQLNIKGTFMCVGQRIQQNPHVLQRIVSEGHVVGNHTWSHPNLTKIPINEVKGQIERTANEIQRIARVRPILFGLPMVH